jgi:hypothetical protein
LKWHRKNWRDKTGRPFDDIRNVQAKPAILGYGFAMGPGTLYNNNPESFANRAFNSESGRHSNFCDQRLQVDLVEVHTEIDTTAEVFQPQQPGGCEEAVQGRMNAAG